MNEMKSGGGLCYVNYLHYYKDNLDKYAKEYLNTFIQIETDEEKKLNETYKEKYGDDWALDVQGHDGEWYKIYAEPGDMIMYESAICEHGRKDPFQGNFYRNFYVHYQLT